MKFRKFALGLTAAATLALFAACLGPAQNPPAAGARWTFIVSGDSRNCGDVVMPGIASSALKYKPEFYWHLGDLRAIYNFDEDILHLPQFRADPPSISAYHAMAWTDYVENQIKPWGSLPFFLGIGNHEVVPPKTREDFITQFANWLNARPIREQREKDDPRDIRVKTYYHWIQRGVDFIFLDNASPDQLDAAQLFWFEGILWRDAADPTIKTVVTGMHAALPDSISYDHSMSDWPVGIVTGRQVYQDLVHVQNDAHKHVYVLASHQHFYMDGIFNTEYLRTHGGVLPGWIVGTAGAQRYPLSPGWRRAKAAETGAYGYLLGQVNEEGEIEFFFQHVQETDIPAPVKQLYTSDFVHWCFAENKRPQ